MRREMCHGLCGKFHGELNGEKMKTTNICQSYERMYSGTVFFDSLCIAVTSSYQFIHLSLIFRSAVHTRVIAWYTLANNLH